MTDKTVAYRRKSAADRRQELIQAGIQCLGRGGMVGFTIDEICRQAQVSRGLINHHFRGKQDLLLAIYTEMTEHLVLDSGAQSARELLASVIDTNFDEASFNKSNLRAWLSIWGQVPTQAQLSALHYERYRNYQQDIEQALRDLVAQDDLDIDTDSLARQLIALIDGLWLEYCLHSENLSLQTARDDCYRLLRSYGIELN